MAAGIIIRIKVGRLAGKLAEVVNIAGRTITVCGSFGTTSFLCSEVEEV